MSGTNLVICGPRQIRWMQWLFIAVVSILRLYMSGRDEIVAMPPDSSNYALQAVHYFDGSHYDRFPINPPGLAIFTKTVVAIGLPYKLSMDLLLIATGLVGRRALSCLTGSWLLGAVLFVGMIFSPWFMFRSRVYMTEPMAGLLFVWLFVFGAYVVFWPHRNRAKWPIVVAVGFLHSSFLLVRPETPVLIAFWGVLTFAAVLANWRFLRRGLSRRWLLQLVCVPVIALGVIFCMKQIHGVHFGVKGISCGGAPGLVALMNSLYTIPPEEEKRFAPVTRQSIALACDHSQTLNQYRRQLLNVNMGAYRIAKQQHDIDGEFASILNWHLINCFGGINKSSNSAMLAASKELRQAQRDQKLGWRFGMYPIDPLWRQWIEMTPNYFGQALKASVIPSDKLFANDQLFDRGPVDAVMRSYFDDGLLRRNGTRAGLKFQVYGSLKGKSQFERVRFWSKVGRPLGMARIMRQAAEGGSESRSFEFNFEDQKQLADQDVFIEFVNDEDEQSVQRRDVRQRLQPTVMSKIEANSEENGGLISETWIVQFTNSGPISKLQRNLQQKLSANYIFGLAALITVGFLVGVFQRTGRRRTRLLRWLVFAGWGWVCVRSAFYVLIEVWLHWGMDRYVEPNSLLTLFVMMLTAFLLGQGARIIWVWIFWRRKHVVILENPSVSVL